MRLLTSERVCDCLSLLDLPAQQAVLVASIWHLLWLNHKRARQIDNLRVQVKVLF